MWGVAHAAGASLSLSLCLSLPLSLRGWADACARGSGHPARGCIPRLSGVGLTRNPGAQMQLERDANAQVDQQRAAQQAGQDQQRVARVEQVIPVPDALFLCRSGHPRAIFKGLTVLR